MSDDVIRIKTRVKYQGAWMPWRELANDYSIVNVLGEKAPGGFGLGSDPSPFSDANDCIINGWYKDASGQAKNTPWNFSHIFVTTYQSNAYIRQDAYITGGSASSPLAYHAVRIKHPNFLKENDFWGPWEYESGIPMQLGVEYRTTERYLGKPVYVRLIDCGNLPDGTTKEVAHGITNLDFIVGAQAIASNSSSGFNGHTYLPAIYNGSLTDRWTDYLAGVDTKNIRIFCGGGLAGCPVYVTFKYTKTTD